LEKPVLERLEALQNMMLGSITAEREMSRIPQRSGKSFSGSPA